MSESHQKQFAAEEQLRQPPTAIPSETSLLGALLLKNDLYGLIAGSLTQADFYRYEHRLIFNAITVLMDRKVPADTINVREYLQKIGMLEDAGGFGYINEISHEKGLVAGPANFVSYANNISEAATRRKLIEVGDQITSGVFQAGDLSAQDLVENAELLIQNLSLKGAKQKDFYTTHDDVASILNDYQFQRDNPGHLPGLSTGFKEVDAFTKGLKPGDLVVVAGATSMGKTAFAMNLVEHCSFIEKKHALIFSLEMTSLQLIKRMAASMAMVDHDKVELAQLTDEEFSLFTSALDKIQSCKHIEIYGSEYSTLFDIRSAARRAKHRHKELGLIVVDYIQLVDAQGGGSNRTRANEVSEVTRGLKLLADSMSCPLIALSQLNRGTGIKAGNRPKLNELKESGSIENDASIVMLLHRDSYYSDVARDKVESSAVEVIMPKNRNGRQGVANLTWHPIHTRFSS